MISAYKIDTGYLNSLKCRFISDQKKTKNVIFAKKKTLDSFAPKQRNIKGLL